MYEELKQMKDEALLEEYSKNPGSNRGLSAHAELQYRQYDATKKNSALLARYNKLIVFITIVIAICGILQALSASVESYIAWKTVSTSSHEIDEIHRELSEIEEKMKGQQRQTEK